ncbi:neuropeptide Y receptor Y8b [Callorhinchus milii]|uniref:Neuropeptide Y receptor Y8 n=1 Tax=Callorhinchus milii TaxID=7868 RepID=C0J0B2_CALMI|nr:neuropeptide Y receptor Y8b [Callorhinchus milii]ACF22978.1 neuropeptide Y receptor Y8 [Callorhinchus milii]
MEEFLKLLFSNHSKFNHTSWGNFNCPGSIGGTTFLVVAYSAIMAMGLIGNVCLVYVITRQKEMHNVTNVLIANLSCSDIVMCAICLPVTLIYTLMDHWILGAALCKLTPFVQCMSVTVSISCLVLIALERHQLIINPTGWKPVVGHAYLAVAVTWIVGCFISLPFMSFNILTDGPYKNISLALDTFADHFACIEYWPSESQRLAYTTCLLLFQYCLPLLLIFVCYFRIFLCLRRRRDMVERPKDANHRLSHSKKINIMLLCIVAAFAVCWLPLMVFNTIFDWNHQAISVCLHNMIFSLSHLTAMFSTCVNPVMYGFLNHNFQKEMKLLIYRCRCRRDREKYETFPLSTVNTEMSKASLHLNCANRNA